MIGALLGTQSNRDVSIVNSFEVIYGTGESKNGEDVEGGDDVDMGGRSAPAVVSEKGAVDAQFLVTRTEQCKGFHVPIKNTSADSMGQSSRYSPRSM